MRLTVHARLRRVWSRTALRRWVSHRRGDLVLMHTVRALLRGWRGDGALSGHLWEIRRARVWGNRTVGNAVRLRVARKARLVRLHRVWSRRRGAIRHVAVGHVVWWAMGRRAVGHGAGAWSMRRRKMRDKGWGWGVGTGEHNVSTMPILLLKLVFGVLWKQAP